MHNALSKAIFEEQTRGLKGDIPKIKRWVIHECNFPILDISFHSPGLPGLRLKFICENFNEEPASVQLLGVEGNRLTHLPPNPTGVFNNSPHPNTGFPFICSIGSKEYHQHPSHLNDLWSSYKDKQSYQLTYLIERYWNAWLKGAAV